MNARRRIAAVVMLAGMSVPVLSACGPSEQEQRESAWQSTKAASTTAALAARQQAAADFAECTGGKDYDRVPCYKQIDERYGDSCADGVDVPSALYEQFYVSMCADEFVRAAASGTPIPTAKPTGGVSVTATTTSPPSTAASTAAPAQQASPSSGIGDALVGFVQLALGALCVLGVPALIIWGAIAGRRRARAVHAQGAEWRDPAPEPAFGASPPNPQGYTDTPPPAPRPTITNPWA